MTTAPSPAPTSPPTGADHNGWAIEVSGLTKRFGSLTAVDDLDFTVRPGRVTGFLGPNGAGKTTTLRMLLGLVRPTSGTATIGGRRYDDLPHPLQTVGAALESTNFHPGRTGRDHLRVLASAGGIPLARADELLEQVGIPAAARKRAGGYSMGMRQRLGLAAALLGDPGVLLLDEPANGLDPEGIRWLRGFLRHLADQGKTILVSSHLLAEMEQTVDDIIIIANGVRVAQGPITELRGEPTALVRSSDPDGLRSALLVGGLTAETRPDGALTVRTDDLARVGQLALQGHVPLSELRHLTSDLEALFFKLTESPEHRNRNLGDRAQSSEQTGQQA
ncbi:MAG: ABC transporter ATP-binding protein [Actinomycetales bacterium]|nr:MAG: ABC transporter ATP-binding protein [Actinomycetales bacterium]